MDSSAFYKRWRESLDGLEAAYRKQAGELESSWDTNFEAEEQRILQNLEELLDDAARTEAQRFERGLDAVERRVGGRPSPTVAQPRLEDLDVRSLHLLARLDSKLRHSIVEACLMNLRAVSDVLDERLKDEKFLGKVERQVWLLPGVLKQIVDFFKRPFFLGISIRDLLPAAYKAAVGAMDALLKLAERFGQRGQKQAPPPLTGKELAAQIDAMSRALSEVHTLLDRERRSLARAARQGVDALRETLETRGIEVTFVNETDGDDRLFLNESALHNAVGELVRNAMRHGLEEGDEQWILVRVLADDPPSTELRIVVENPGATPALEVIDSAGKQALSTSGGGAGLGMVRAAAKEHFGRLEIEARAEGGARFAIVLPRHMPAEEAAAAV